MRARIRTKLTARRADLLSKATADARHRTNLRQRADTVKELNRLLALRPSYVKKAARSSNASDCWPDQLASLDRHVAQLRNEVRARYGVAWRREQARLRQARRRERLKIT